MPYLLIFFVIVSGVKRRLDFDQDSAPSTSTAPPAKRHSKVRRPVFHDDWCSQPVDRLDRIRYEKFVESIVGASDDSPSEPESESTGLTPSEWGEMLGVVCKSLEEEPLVLHCFEDIASLSETEDDSDGGFQSASRKNKN